MKKAKVRHYKEKEKVPAGMSPLPDYRQVQTEKGQLLKFILEGTVLAGIVDFLFFQKWVMLLPLLFIIRFWVKRRCREARDKRQKKLYYDFKDALSSLSASLRAGYSVENAFRETEKNLRKLQGESDLVKELAYINAGISLNRPPEKLFADFAGRSGLEDIENFSSVFLSLRTTGGSMADTIRETASYLEGKIEVEREIDSAIAAKKFEYRLMILMPAFIILYMQLTSPGYLTVLYNSFLGFAVMLACLTGYGAAVCAGAGIVDIKL